MGVFLDWERESVLSLFLGCDERIGTIVWNCAASSCVLRTWLLYQNCLLADTLLIVFLIAAFQKQEILLCVKEVKSLEREKTLEWARIILYSPKPMASFE
jgi:hypothetical protein